MTTTNLALGIYSCPTKKLYAPQEKSESEEKTEKTEETVQNSSEITQNEAGTIHGTGSVERIGGTIQHYGPIERQLILNPVSNILNNLAFQSFTKEQLTSYGLTDEDIEKYFNSNKITNVNTGHVYSDTYSLKSKTINGTECKTIKEAVDAILNEKHNNIVDDIWNRYMNNEINFVDIKGELEKAGAQNVRFEEGDKGFCLLKYTINGEEFTLSNTRNDFDVTVDLTTGEIATSENLNTLDELPDEKTYGSKDLLTIIYGFTEDDINKYFTPTMIGHGSLFTYVLNENIVIDGTAINTLQDLQKILLK